METISAVAATIAIVGVSILGKFQKDRMDRALGKATFTEYHKQILAHVTSFATDEDKFIWAGKEYNLFIRSILTSANRPAVKAAAVAAAEQWLNNY